MDHDRFDSLARRVFADSRRSRRAALSAILGAALLPASSAGVLGKRKNKKRASKLSAQAASRCYPGKNCTPGAGKNTSRCDFAFSTVFRNTDVRGSNLSRSSFRGADLTGADFRGANLSGGCFVGADLTGARVGSSANVGGAIFCNTRMPDGSIDDSGCDQTTACCPPLEQDCADATIKCGIDDGAGFCSKVVGHLGPVAHCGQGTCCGPCQNNDELFWTQQCNATFAECNGGCVATDTGTFPCWIGCVG